MRFERFCLGSVYRGGRKTKERDLQLISKAELTAFFVSRRVILFGLVKVPVDNVDGCIVVGEVR